MFDDKFFEQWLDNQAQREVNLVADGKAITPEEMMMLVLKALTNHFAHLNIELREQMKGLREDMDKRFDYMREEMNKRFEQVDNRFETLTRRIDRFMIWSFATTLTVRGIVIFAIKFLP